MDHPYTQPCKDNKKHRPGKAATATVGQVAIDLVVGLWIVICVEFMGLWIVIYGIDFV